MRRRNRHHILTDSGFVIALYSATDPREKRAAIDCFEELEGRAPIWMVPWPTLYEAVKRPLTANPKAIEEWDREWAALERAERLLFLDDSPWRRQALEDVRAWRIRPSRNARAVSLVDRVLCGAIEDGDAGIGVFVTTDPDDFRRSCARAGVGLREVR